MNSHALDATQFHGVRQRVLSHLVSAPGQRAAESWFPSSDPDQVLRLTEETAEMRAFLSEGGDFSLEELVQPDDLLRKARPEAACLLPPEMASVKRLCLLNRLCRATFSPLGDRFPLLTELAKGLPGLHQLEGAIGKVLDENGEFKDSASQNLAHIRGDMAATKDAIRNLYRTYLARHGSEEIFQEDIITTRAGRWVLLVRAQARSRFPGIVHDRTDSGAGLYLEPREAMEMNNRLMELSAEEETEKRRLLILLTDAVRERQAEIAAAAAILGALDLVRARALYGIKGGHVRPVGIPAPSGECPPVRLLGARHPLLEGIPGRLVVPLDLELDPRTRALIITGPNTGGKTVALKTVGLMALMAQAGLFLPAAEGTSLPVFGEIFADIGDEQSLEQNLSTFSAHVRNIAQAVRECGPDSLILLDELGAGTDPSEGAPLAMALLEQFISRGALTIASTHQGALVSFALRTEGAINGSMEFEPQTLQPTYRLIMGIPGRSNALAVARQMGIPAEILRRSEELQSGGERDMAGVVARLDARRRELEEMLARLGDREKLLFSLTEKSARDLEALTSGKEAVLREARREAKRVLDGAREEVRRIVASAGRDASEAHRRLRHLGQDVAASLPAGESRPSSRISEPRLGQSVRLPRTSAQGKITSLDKERQKARVEMGGKTVEVPVHALEELTGDPLKHGRGAQRGGYEAVPAVPVSGRLDLRGKRAEEAASETLKFLDHAWHSGMESVEILHGKGLGRLKDAVARVAGEHPGVRSLEPAPNERGGHGVTVVKFK